MRLVMMGTGAFAEPIFDALLHGPHPVVGLVTQPDREIGHVRGSTRQTGRGMKVIAQEHGIPVFQPETPNSPEGIAGIQAFQPDLLVVAAYGHILSKDVLAVAPRGGINVHASLLPKYRGAAPIAWAIYHGEKQSGVTIIRMSVFLDAGDILAQEAIDILPDETAGELEARLSPLGAKLAMQVIDRFAAGDVQGTQQDKSQVTKAPKLTKENGSIDWNHTHEQVCCQIRAMQPWPTAYTFLHCEGKPAIRVIVLRAVAFPVRYDPSVLPGSMFIDKHFPGSLFVAAGLVDSEERSVVEVLELQPAGKKRMSASEFLRGHPPKPGDCFGPETP